MGNSNENRAKSAKILAEFEIRYAVVQLDYPLQKHQIPHFRRFINQFVGEGNNMFHNHSGPKKYIYRYPLVQYKTFKGKASLMGISDAGVASLHELMQHPGFREACRTNIGEQFVITEEVCDTLAIIEDPSFCYKIASYIPLNDDNKRRWNNPLGLTERVKLLESCLTGHILKFVSAIKWKLPQRSLMVEILDYEQKTMRSFNNPFLEFDMLFRTNIALPEGIGLGKSVSHGFGNVHICE